MQQKETDRDLLYCLGIFLESLAEVMFLDQRRSKSTADELHNNNIISKIAGTCWKDGEGVDLFPNRI